MGRTLIIGDTHIWNHKWQGGQLVDGVNRRCREIVESILGTVDAAKREYGITSVVQLGDFFDGPKPSAALLDISIRMIKETGLPWHIIAGNHDIASYDAPSAIAPLGHVDGIHVYEKPTLVNIDGHQWAMVPYMGPNAVEALTKALPILQQANYAAVHYGLVYGPGSRTDLIDKDQWSALCKHGDRLQVPPFGFFGHEHNSRVAGVNYRSVGAYTQSNFSDAHGAPSVVSITSVYSDHRFFDSNYAVVGPRFYNLCHEQVLNLRTLALYGSRVFNDPIYIMVGVHQVAEAQSLLDAGIIQGYKVQPMFVDASGTVSELVVPCAAESTMDVVYSTAGSIVPAEILEDVVTILEQDMQE